MSLGLFNWLLVIPKVGLLAWQQAVVGGPNWTRLNVLKNSVRNSQTEPFTRTEVRRLFYREIPVIDSFAPKRWVHARLVPETKVAGSCEASRVEPGDATRRSYVRGTLGASRHNIRAQSPDSQTRL